MNSTHKTLLYRRGLLYAPSTLLLPLLSSWSGYFGICHHTCSYLEQRICMALGKPHSSGAPDHHVCYDSWHRTCIVPLKKICKTVSVVAVVVEVDPHYNSRNENSDLYRDSQFGGHSLYRVPLRIHRKEVYYGSDKLPPCSESGPCRSIFLHLAFFFLVVVYCATRKSQQRSNRTRATRTHTNIWIQINKKLPPPIVYDYSLKQ